MPSADHIQPPQIIFESASLTASADQSGRYQIEHGSAIPTQVIIRKYAGQNSSNAISRQVDNLQKWAPSAGSVKASFLPIENEITGGTAQWRHGLNLISEQVSALENQTKSNYDALSNKVDMLSQAIDILLSEQARREGYNNSSSVSNFHELPALNELRKEEFDADILNGIADGNIKSDGKGIDYARSALTSSDPSLRAAAGRAISALDSTVAQALLPGAIDREEHKFVRSVLRAALAAAKV